MAQARLFPNLSWLKLVRLADMAQMLRQFVPYRLPSSHWQNSAVALSLYWKKREVRSRVSNVSRSKKSKMTKFHMSLGRRPDPEHLPRLGYTNYHSRLSFISISCSLSCFVSSSSSDFISSFVCFISDCIVWVCSRRLCSSKRSFSICLACYTCLYYTIFKSVLSLYSSKARYYAR